MCKSLWIVGLCFTFFISCADGKVPQSNNEEMNGFIQSLVGEELKDQIVEIDGVSLLNRFSVTHGIYESVKFKRISFKVKADLDVNSLRKLILGIIDNLASSSGRVVYSEVGFPPATFTILVQYNELRIKIDGVITNEKNDIKDVVLFLNFFNE